MTRKSTTISINVLSVLIILISVFVGVVGHSNAWFSAEHKDGVQIIVQVGDLKLSLYQDSIDINNIIYTYEDNDKLTENAKKYVTFSEETEILPDVPVALTLILANEDAGSASMYVRYKLELYARGGNKDTLIPIKLIGNNENFELKPLAQDDVNSGYYYYKESTATTSKNGLFAQNEEGEGVVLLTHFKIEFSSLLDENGNLLNINSETIYLKLTVDASLTDWLGETAW